MEPGRWALAGNWLERDQMPVHVKGRILIGWSRDDWFTMVTKLVFPDTEIEAISQQYRGRMDSGDRQYTFVLQHSLLGKVEGEGWVAPETIVQRYWVLGDRQRRTGFETLRRDGNDKYSMSSAIMAGHYLTSAMEAVLTYQGTGG